MIVLRGAGLDVMDAEVTRRVVATAAGLIAEQRRCVEQQRQLVAELETMGVDTTRARQKLARFEKMQQAHEERLTALQREMLETGVTEITECWPPVVSRSENGGDIHRRRSEVHRG